MNITKARLEGLFVDELERFQPTPGYMLLKESVLRVWHDRKASVKNQVASAEQRATAIQQKLKSNRRNVFSVRVLTAD